ncbi:MAG: hypothetical protein RIF32_12455 [Leptospirales bacterium]|jgi:glyoxylase-like metal-dependent hydrolase (beta-lactamase superfamily II)
MGAGQGPCENFDRSHDAFGDGSVVLVPLPEHTTGSTGMFLTVKSGKRYFFIGDLTWAREGVSIPAKKHFVSSKLVDYNRDETTASIVKVHHLSKKYPELVILPARDHKSASTLAVFPDFENSRSP